MPDLNDYPKDYRPETYWDTPVSILANVKGVARKRRARELLEAGEHAELNEFLLCEQLPDDVRKLTGAIHPYLWGGEYLPDYDASEVEIARVCVKSTLSDATSIRARWDAKDRLIRYRICDEYGTEYRHQPETSELPLTLEELIGLIDSATGGDHGMGLTDGIRNMNYGLGAEASTLRNFVAVESDFYPDLGRWYDQEAEEWLERVVREEQEEYKEWEDEYEDAS